MEKQKSYPAILMDVAAGIVSGGSRWVERRGPCVGRWFRAGERLRRPAPLIAVLALLVQSPFAHAQSDAVSTTFIECLTQEPATTVGAITANCLHLQDANFARAEATAQTFLGDRPGASAGILRSNTPGHFIQQVQASAQLTYEMRLGSIAAPPANLTFIPVKVSVIGTVARSETFQGLASNPTSTGSASVFIRSDPSLVLTNADVLKEQAFQGQAATTPNFDKIVGISLIPGHVYTVDLLAGCSVSDGGFVKVQFSSESGCSALADPKFELDQEKLDQQLGAGSFSLASFYRFEYSQGVSPVPEPGTAGALMIGLAGLALVRWRRSRTAPVGDTRRG